MSMASVSIGLSGMRLAEARLNAGASNIANVETNGAVPGSGSGSPVYQPMDVVAVQSPGGVDYTVQRRDNAYGLAYDPSASYADANGMVATPSVDLAAELVETMQARMLYQASAMVMRTSNAMEKALLDRFA